MNILFTIVGCLVMFAWGFANGVVCYGMSISQMYEEFITEQCFVGKICANIFYAPAWCIKWILRMLHSLNKI